MRRECLRLPEGHRKPPQAQATSEDLLAEVVDPQDAIALRQRIELLAGALADLDPHYGEVGLLREIQELSAPEGAAQLGTSIDALKKQADITTHVTIHGLRRTATDLPRRAAVDPVAAKAIIGHSTDRMREHYSTVGPDEARGIGARLVSLVPAVSAKRGS